MKKLTLILGLAMLWPLSPSWAQLAPPNEAGVTLGAWHTIVRNVETTKKWWELWGGKPMKIDGVDVIKMRGVFIFMVQGEPNGPTIDHFIDHVAFQSTDCFDLMKALVAGGVKTEPIDPKTMRGVGWTPADETRVWTYAYSPDGLRVEVVTDDDAVAAKDLTAGTNSDMMHIYFKDLPSLRAHFNWYRKYFGAQPKPDTGVNLHLPGTKWNYAVDNGSERGAAVRRAKGEPRPSNRGGALDYVGFEVKNLQAFEKKLEADGVKFDEPYSKKRHKSYASAQLTGPGGELIELTEGLNKFLKAVEPGAAPFSGLGTATIPTSCPDYSPSCMSPKSKDYGIMGWAQPQVAGMSLPAVHKIHAWACSPFGVFCRHIKCWGAAEGRAAMKLRGIGGLLRVAVAILGLGVYGQAQPGVPGFGCGPRGRRGSQRNSQPARDRKHSKRYRSGIEETFRCHSKLPGRPDLGSIQAAHARREIPHRIHGQL